VGTTRQCAERTVFTVRLRPKAGIADGDAIKALRLFLKKALREFGLKCVGVWEDNIMSEASINTNSEFRQAVARATKTARDVLLSHAIPAERKARELGDSEVSWIAMATIGSWTQSQRDCIAQAANGAGFVEQLLKPLGAMEGFAWDAPIGAWPPEMMTRFLTQVLVLTVQLKIPLPPFFAAGRDPLAEIIAYTSIDEIPGDKAPQVSPLANNGAGDIVCRLGLEAANPLRPGYAQYAGASFGHKPLAQMAPLHTTPYCMTCNVERECTELTRSRIANAGAVTA
jgi:hypothetical protein